MLMQAEFWVRTLVAIITTFVSQKPLCPGSHNLPPLSSKCELSTVILINVYLLGKKNTGYTMYTLIN